MTTKKIKIMVRGHKIGAVMETFDWGTRVWISVAQATRYDLHNFCSCSEYGNVELLDGFSVLEVK
jgi:hypothetical protein